MPPKYKVSRQQIIEKAIEEVRAGGIDSLNARTLAAAMSLSTQPIFSNFTSMAELKAEIIKQAQKMYFSYVEETLKSGKYPNYKSSGIAYIRFAKEEKELFKLLFMRDREKEEDRENSDDYRDIINMICVNLGLSYERALEFHAQMWVVVHGIATMIATGYYDWDIETASAMLTDAYEGLKYRFLSKGDTQ